MFKDDEGAINVSHSMNCTKPNARINLTLLNQKNETIRAAPVKRPYERNGYENSPAVLQAVEQIALSFAGLFKSVMKHAAILEEEIGRQAMEHFHLGCIQDSCARGVNLVYRLLILNGKIPMRMERFDFNDIIRSIDPLISGIIRDNIAVEIDTAEDRLPMIGDLRFIKQAIAELILNAKDALSSGGTITLATRKARLKRHSPILDSEKTVSCALFSVTDSGCGINDETKRHAFKPFFSTKPKEMSIGLGLPLVEKVVRDHNGTLNITSRNEEGTSVRVYLPLLKLHEDVNEKGLIYAVQKNGRYRNMRSNYAEQKN